MMNNDQRKTLEREIYELMKQSISDDYVLDILREVDEETDNTILDDIIEDIVETSAWEEEGYYNEDDIRLAIGRVLIYRLGIVR